MDQEKKTSEAINAEYHSANKKYNKPQGGQECFILYTKGNMFFINCIKSLLWFKIPNNEGNCSLRGIWKALNGLMTRLSLSVNNSILIEQLWQCKITLKINPLILGKSNSKIQQEIFSTEQFSHFISRDRQMQLPVTELTLG